MTTPNQLDSWLELAEDEHLEFKEAKSRFDFEELVKYVVAMANEKGGRIILGVSDRLPRQVVGTQAFPDLEKTRAALTDRIRLRIDAEEIDHPRGRVVIFHVPSRPIGMPVHYEGRYFMRSGEQLVPMLPDVLKRIFDESGPDFSAEVCPGATVADLDTAAVEEFRRRWIRKSGRKDLEAMPSADLLEGAELVLESAVTYAALILLGTRTALGRFLPQSEVVFEYRSGEASGPAQARTEYRQGFFAFHDTIWEQINLRNDLQHFQDGLFMLDIRTFNEDAIREALLNAVSHRDYRMGGSTFVRQYPRRIEIVNPGAPPLGITFENILWQQSPRNRRVAEALARCGLVERSGQGMNTIYETCIRESKANPDFRLSDNYHFGLCLDGQIRYPEFLRVLERMGEERVNSFSTYDLMVIELLYENRPIPEKLTSYLLRLVDEGIVERTHGVRDQKFVLARVFYLAVGEKGVYTRKKGLDRATNKQLLLKHIRENQKTGSKMEELKQVLPSVDRNHMTVLMRELSEAGLVHVHGRTRAALWFDGRDDGACHPSLRPGRD